MSDWTSDWCALKEKQMSTRLWCFWWRGKLFSDALYTTMIVRLGECFQCALHVSLQINQFLTVLSGEVQATGGSFYDESLCTFLRLNVKKNEKLKSVSHDSLNLIKAWCWRQCWQKSWFLLLSLSFCFSLKSENWAITGFCAEIRARSSEGLKSGRFVLLSLHHWPHECHSYATETTLHLINLNISVKLSAKQKKLIKINFHTS